MESSYSVCSTGEDIQAVALLERCISRDIEEVNKIFTYELDGRSPPSTAVAERIQNIRCNFFEQFFKDKTKRHCITY